MLLQKENLILIVVVCVINSLVSADACLRTCGTGKSAKTVQYPFGFSEGCRIRLNCSESDSTIRIGDFEVRNVTSENIFVKLPAKCNRPNDSLRPLFSDYYRMTAQNSFFVNNCTPPQDSYSIPKSFVNRYLNLSSCGFVSDSFTCYSPAFGGNRLLTYDNLSQTGCNFLFSAISFDPGEKDSGGSIEFQRIELGWWLNGESDCSRNAKSTTVTRSNGTSGYRCRCEDSFEGDGFAGGTGCQKISDCNPSKYISGQCREARIGAIIGGLIAATSLIVGLTLICYCIRRRRSTTKNHINARRLLSEAAGNSSVPFFPYKELERATTGFSEDQRLGTGAYGTVYAGKLQNDEWVAIKRIRYKDTDSIDQVMNEVKLLSSVSHPNLVRLLGCCIEEGEPILVYEYMPNGTLCQHLQRERGRGIPWTVRLTIATETAQAIAYLHSAMNPPIYHRDIKSSNILLDYDYKSKVADFGLSRLALTELSHISTAPQGTPGYLDPQYHQYFHLSDKSDVYSFGVVLVEIITALKVVDFSRSHSEVNLAALAIDRIGRGCIDEIIDPYIEPHRDAWTLSSINNVAELAFRCLAFHRDMRPSMMEVAEELEHIRASAWTSNIYLASPATSYGSSLDGGSERSLGGVMAKKAGVKSQRLVVTSRISDNLTKLEEVKDSSPVSVQEPWLSEQSSPSENSLLGHMVQ